MFLSATFNEEHWLSSQARRSRELRQHVLAWLPAQIPDGVLGKQVTQRLAAVESDGRPASPGTFAMAMAESLAASADNVLKVGLAAHVYWAAADVADDIDDQDAGAPAANLACALLFLAQQALIEISPRAAQEGIRYGLRMAAGQALDLASTDRPEPPDIAAIIRDKAGAELEFFMLLAGESAGVHDGRLLALGCEFGKSLQILSDVVDLYVKANADDFVAGKWTLPLARLWGESVGRASRLPALLRAEPAVQARVRFEAAGAARAALAGIDIRLADLLENAIALLPEPAPFSEALTWVSLAAEAMQEALSDLPEAALPPVVAPAQAVARAASFLEQTTIQEEHRWGLFGAPLVTAGLFTGIFRAAALRACGANWQPVFRDLLAMRDADGWRYYPHRPEISPDADDAGLILGYLGDQLPEAIRLATVAQLVASFHGDTIHTWLGPAEGEVEWTGDDCLASLANASWGLMRVGSGAQIPDAVLLRLQNALFDDRLASPFYEAYAVRFFVHRALAEAVSIGRLDAAAARALRSLLERQLQQEQRLAGNFGDHFTVNAVNILAAKQWKIPLHPGLPYWLAARQAESGAWPAEPVFMGPGVHMRPQRWGHEGLTTSWVLLALADAV